MQTYQMRELETRFGHSIVKGPGMIPADRRQLGSSLFPRMSEVAHYQLSWHYLRIDLPCDQSPGFKRYCYHCAGSNHQSSKLKLYVPVGVAVALSLRQPGWMKGTGNHSGDVTFATGTSIVDGAATSTIRRSIQRHHPEGNRSHSI
jgi:hypothetical protein